jgi:hypothetical protein
MGSMDTEADSETEKLFSWVGRYVVFFQLVESRVDECLLLLWGHENWQTSQAILADMSNADRVKMLLRLFHDCPENARGRSRPDWVKSFEHLIDELHAERVQRNRLLHSHFLFESLEIGQPVLMVDRKSRRAGKGDTGLSEAFQKTTLDGVVNLYLRISHAHVQLTHDYGAPVVEEGAAAT